MMIEQIKTYIKEELAVTPNIEIDDSDDLLNSGLIDSVGIVRLVSFIEEKAEIKISPNEMVIENFISLAAIEQFIEQKKL